MATLYRTKEGDVLDAICFTFYHNELHLPAVLEVNPGLAEQPELLPMGIEIYLPDLATPSRTRYETRVWD